jgi:hypothetical protein
LARDDATPGAVFHARAEAFRTEARRLTSRFNRFANLRLIAFAAAAAGLIWESVSKWGQGLPVSG